MSKKDQITELTPDEIEAEKLKRKRKATRRKIGVVIDRIFGFILATVIMFGLAGLGLEYVLIKGPSPALRDTFVYTMLDTRRFRFIPRVYLTDEEMQPYLEQKKEHVDAEFDPSLITIKPADGENGEQPADSQYTEDEDGDGIIFENIKKGNYVGYLITILDPTRVFVAVTDNFGVSGRSLDYYCEKYGALGGINGGGFVDEDGSGSGGIPQGLTFAEGTCYSEGYGESSFVGIDDQGLLHIGYYTYDNAVAMNIVGGVTFDPILVLNGEACDVSYRSTGINPRTAIGQRADGAILMLCVDGRQAHSAGCTYQDLADIMMEHGAINAINLDGGSSSSMWYDGEYVNKCSSAAGFSRSLTDVFLFK